MLPTHFSFKDTYSLKAQRWKKIFHTNEIQKKTGIIYCLIYLYSGKQTSSIITRDKDHYRMIKQPTQENIKVVNIYASNTVLSKCIKETITLLFKNFTALYSVALPCRASAEEQSEPLVSIYTVHPFLISFSFRSPQTLSRVSCATQQVLIRQLFFVHSRVYSISILGFQGGMVAKKPPANVGDASDVSLIPGLGRSRGEELETHCSILGLEDSIDRGAQQATYSSRSYRVGHD